MKKLQLFICLLLLFASSAFAGVSIASSPDDVPALNFVVWTHSGEKVGYLLAEHPVVTTSGDKLILTTRTGVVEYVASDVKKFTFEPIYYFVTWLNDGSRYAYALAEHPVVTYSDGELLLETNAQQVSYSAAEVRKFTFSLADISCDGELPPATGVSSLECQQQFSLQQGDVHFSGCRTGSPICIYTLDGKLLQRVTADANGNARLVTGAYPGGVYIIKTETITHKIIKR